MTVSLQKHGQIAVVTIDNPPVNATSHAVRLGLQNALHQTTQDDDVQSVVLHCAGRTFVAGADITEFGAPPQDPSLPDLLAQIEAAPKPWVAAIHGTSLGGGLETALVCHYRIADPAAKLALPEVTLGLIPGAGGTVRLPRLIAPEQAVEMIAGGKPVTAARALELGLIDQIASADLLGEAIALAEGATRRAPLTMRPFIAVTSQDTWDNAAQKIKTKARGQTSPIAAITALENALKMDAPAALAAERALFEELRDSDQCKALRHIFFAERATAQAGRIKGVAATPLSQVGVVGGGTMGAGIAAACLLAGYPVTLIERNNEAAVAGRDRVLATLDQSLKRGVLTTAAHLQAVENFHISTNYTALSDADLVIEAVFEDMQVKIDVLTALEAAVRPDAILATNTSYLDINVMAAALTRPSRVIGLHFFSPAHIMKLLEIVVTDSVDDQTTATAFAFAKRLKKIAVRAKVGEGFIANRIMSAYRREAEYMLEDGAMPWDIDTAMRKFGFPMGIFEMQDLAGLDISWAMRKRLNATRDRTQRYVDIGDKLCEGGHFGRKTGRGYYDYSDSGKARPSAETRALIMAESRRKGITRVQISDKAIMARILGRIRSEAAMLLHEGIARCADDIDVVMVNAFGFPRWTGGPMFHTSGQD